jgi:ferritin-like metal-binding protein YciE
MAEVETLHEALIDELKDLYNGERQLTKSGINEAATFSMREEEE